MYPQEAMHAQYFELALLIDGWQEGSGLSVYFGASSCTKVVWSVVVVVIMSHFVVRLYKLTCPGEFTRMVDHSLNYDGSCHLLSSDVCIQFDVHHA